MLTTLVEILLPPASLAWLALLLLLLPSRAGRGGRPARPRRGPRVLASLLLVLLVLLSTPLVSFSLLRTLTPPEEAAAPEPAPGAIVILSAEAELNGGPTRLDVGPLTLERERAGAALARRTGLPVLVTGGLVNGPPPVAAVMAGSMQEDFGVPVTWTELRSPTTWENAHYSAPILRAAGVTRVYLVTHVWHMRRSLLAFRRAGIDAVAAPVRPDVSLPPIWKDLVPRVSAWQRSYYAVHEWVGLLFYTWRA